MSDTDPVTGPAEPATVSSDEAEVAPPPNADALATGLLEDEEVDDDEDATDEEG